MATSPSDLVRACGINRTYAWQLLKERRKPSLELALQIHATTGEQLGKLKGLSPDEIQDLREALDRLAA